MKKNMKKNKNLPFTITFLISTALFLGTASAKENQAPWHKEYQAMKIVSAMTLQELGGGCKDSKKTKCKPVSVMAFLEAREVLMSVVNEEKFRNIGMPAAALQTLEANKAVSNMADALRGAGRDQD